MFKSYRLSYTPLSPLHIGIGDSYDPSQYVIDGEALYEFDSGGLIALCSAADRAELLNITAGKPGVDMVEALQTFLYRRRHGLKPWAVNTIPVLPGVAAYYRTKVENEDGARLINKLEIERTAHDPIDRQPLLFGSSIKGAIRTALLDTVNQGWPLAAKDARWFKVDGLDMPQRRHYEREQKKLYPQLSERLFDFRTGKFERDPMRLVQLSDAGWDGRDNLPKSRVLITVNRKKDKVTNKYGVEQFSQAEKNENLCKLFECVSAWRYRAFSGSLNIQQMEEVSFDGDLKSPRPDLRFSIEQIAKACSAFYLPILKAEINLLRRRGFLDAEWGHAIETMLEKTAGRMRDGRAFLLRVGRHSGAEAITLNGVRHIRIMKGRPEYQTRTKTLWLAAERPDQRTELLPFGWVLVEIWPDDGTTSACPELAELCRQQQERDRQWLQRHGLDAAKDDQVSG